MTWLGLTFVLTANLKLMKTPKNVWGRKGLREAGQGAEVAAEAAGSAGRVEGKARGGEGRARGERKAMGIEDGEGT